MKKLIILISLISLEQNIFAMEKKSKETKKESSAFANSISGDKEEDIYFEGKNKPLLGHIVESTFDSNYPFSVTPVFRYREENGKEVFNKLGDILDLEESDIEGDIANGNWLYTPSILVPQKTRLSGVDYDKKVGALILGIKDTNKIDSLYFSLANQMRDNAKKSKAKQ